MPLSPVYVLLVGLPAAGKSTITNKMFEAWRRPKPVVLSTDAYIETTAHMRSSTYSEVFKDTIDVATKYVNALRTDALRASQDIIHDQTNLTVKSRAQKLAGIPGSYRKICVVVEASEYARQHRLLDRPGKVIPEHVDATMRASWQLPTYEEGFDDIFSESNWEEGMMVYGNLSSPVLWGAA